MYCRCILLTDIMSLVNDFDNHRVIKGICDDVMY